MSAGPTPFEEPGHRLPFFTCLRSEWQVKVSAHKNRAAGGPLQNTRSRCDQFTLLKITPASMSLINFSLRQQLHPLPPNHIPAPPRALWHQQVLLSLDLQHMLPDSRIAAEGPHRSSFSAPSFVSHCSFGSMPFLFSRVKSSLWNMAFWNIHFKSHKRNSNAHSTVFYSF